MTPPSAPPIRRKKKLQSATRKMIGMIQPTSSASHLFGASPVNLTLVRFEILDELRIFDADRDEGMRAFRAVLHDAADTILGDDDLLDGAVAHALLEFAVGDRFAALHREVEGLPERAGAETPRARTTCRAGPVRGGSLRSPDAAHGKPVCPESDPPSTRSYVRDGQNRQLSL